VGWVRTVFTLTDDVWGTTTLVRSVDVATVGPIDTDDTGELRSTSALDVGKANDEASETWGDVVQSAARLTELWTTTPEFFRESVGETTGTFWVDRNTPLDVPDLGSPVGDSWTESEFVWDTERAMKTVDDDWAPFVLSFNVGEGE
jgi:hypothetical protein